MTSLELAVIQGAVLILIAPVCARIGATLVTLVRQKTWTMPWVAYRRENSVVAAVAFGVAVTFAVLLPLMGFDGLATTDGSVFVLIALLALVGVAVAILETASLIPTVLCAVGTAFLALAVATNSINGPNILLATAGDARPAIILAAVGIGLALIALWNDTAASRVQDVRVVLLATVGVFLVNLVAMMTVGNALLNDGLALNMLILAGKAIGAALIVGILATGIQRHASVTPTRLVRTATFLGILSIIVTLWQRNLSL